MEGFLSDPEDREQLGCTVQSRACSRRPLGQDIPGIVNAVSPSILQQTENLHRFSRRALPALHASPGRRELT